MAMSDRYVVQKPETGHHRCCFLIEVSLISRKVWRYHS